MAFQHYASEGMVKFLQNSSDNSADYVYSQEETVGLYDTIVQDVNWIIEKLSIILDVKIDLCFSVVASRAPFKIALCPDGSAAILVDRDAFFDVVQLCVRMQTLPFIADKVSLNEIAVGNNFHKKFMIDIVREFIKSSAEDLDCMLQANEVYMSAIIFIIGHEISHVTHGHLDFIKSADFREFCNNEENKNLTRRTLEMDSDSSGTTCVVDIFGIYINNRKYHLGNNEKIGNDFIISRCILGIFSALLYLDARSPSLISEAYPIGYARFLTAYSVLQLALAKQIGPEAAGIPEAMRKAIAEAFVSLSGGLEFLAHPMVANMMVMEEDRDPQYVYHDLGVLAGHEHLVPLFARWARLHPFLLKYQKGGKLAPPAAPPM